MTGPDETTAAMALSHFERAYRLGGGTCGRNCWPSMAMLLLAATGFDGLAPQQSEQTQELLRLYLFAGIAVTFGLAALLSFGIRA